MKILLAHNDPKTLALIFGHLSQQGMDVTPTESASEVLYSDTRFDAVILNESLSVIDGLSLLRAMRDQGNNTPVLFLGNGHWHRVVTALDEGADNYVAAPFNHEEIAAKIALITKRTYTGLQPVAIDRNLNLNFMNCSLEHNGKNISLKQTQYKILAALVKSNGSLTTEKELITALYDEFDPKKKDSLKVFIYRLRNVLSPLMTTSEIVTVRGEGYRLDMFNNTASLPEQKKQAPQSGPRRAFIPA